MMQTAAAEDIPVPRQVWEDTGSSGRSVSEGSLNAATSSEQLALSGFAFQLTSIIGSDDGTIADEVDVQEEAKLLMSLSCSTPSTTNNNNKNNNFNNNMNITTNSTIHKTNATTASTATSSTNTSSTTTTTGRITPPSDTSSCYSSTSSKRDSFCFTCPSLSLENHSRDVETSTSTHHATTEPSFSSSSSTGNSQSSLPSVLLGRSLKIDDKDALRLSSEAMGRNILQSYKKALDWRLKSWEHSLSRVLVDKERDLTSSTKGGASQEALEKLLRSGEANLLLALKAMETKLRVMDATTSFKVLPQRLNKHSNNNSEQQQQQQRASKKQRLELGSSSSSSPSGLEETEYEYQVAHAMILEGCLNIHTPAGYCKIELEVPGSMTGTFLSCCSSAADVVGSSPPTTGEELTDVRIDVNTDILAAMIEKSSRTVIRAAVEAVLKGEVDVEATATATAGETTKKEQAATAVEQKKKTSKTTPRSNTKGRKPKNNDTTMKKEVETTTPSPNPVTTTTTTPKRKLSEERMSRMVVITPARNAASSPSSFGDSDYEDNKPVLLSLPDSFPSSSSSCAESTSKPSLRMLTTTTTTTPKLPSRVAKKAKKSSASATTLPTVVTPHKTHAREAITKGAGPTLPLLVEVACAMVKK